ncbi:hypothetical protein P7K49_002030 [Saguinus oedipus]|uniref:Sulfhydryl oxidase Trx-like domain-containing protein n=1 Tax=Saguinus oedipus TaxID=9490 RepID=A0ABQ9WG57_SAGOE|nr:hypothetical protein P7K49_002030 [Saguinus oedipus]
MPLLWSLCHRPYCCPFSPGKTKQEQGGWGGAADRGLLPWPRSFHTRDRCARPWDMAGVCRAPLDQLGETSCPVVKGCLRGHVSAQHRVFWENCPPLWTCHYVLITQVILDLIPYENIVVTRALDWDKAFLEKLGVSSVPSCFLIHPNGSCGLINV